MQRTVGLSNVCSSVVSRETQASHETSALSWHVLQSSGSSGNSTITQPYCPFPCLYRRSVTPLSGLLLQLAVDVGASFGAFGAATALGSTDDFPFRIGLEAIFFFLTWYFGIQVRGANNAYSMVYGRSRSTLHIVVESRCPLRLDVGKVVGVRTQLFE